MKNPSHNFRLTTSLAVLLAGSLFLGAARGADLVPASAIDTQGSIPFMTGGVGETERERLEEVSKAFNLRVVTAEPAGNYLSGVNVIVRDQRGAEMLATVTQGPWLLAKLPPGKYTVLAITADQRQQRTVTISGDQQSMVLFHLTSG